MDSKDSNPYYWDRQIRNPNFEISPNMLGAQKTSIAFDPDRNMPSGT